MELYRSYDAIGLEGTDCRPLTPKVSNGEPAHGEKPSEVTVFLQIGVVRPTPI